MREVIGPEGTILLPVSLFHSVRMKFSTSRRRRAWKEPGVRHWSFWSTFAACPEWFGHADPIYSVAGLGPRAEELLTRLPNTSYGKDCLYERLVKSGGKICGIGVGLAETPFLHYVEEAVGVPFRYKKLFTGRISHNGKVSNIGWISSVPIQSPSALPDGTRLEKIARSEGLCRVADVGLGEIVSIDCRSFYELAKREIANDPWITARGPAVDPL